MQLKNHSQYLFFQRFNYFRYRLSQNLLTNRLLFHCSICDINDKKAVNTISHLRIRFYSFFTSLHAVFRQFRVFV